MIFDTHAHYDDEQFDADREELLNAMPELGVGNIVNVAASLRSCGTTFALAERYPHVYAAIGVHPDEVGELSEEGIAYMESLLGAKKVVAVGEIGLDYYWDNEQHDVQKKWFIRQLEMARKARLPVIIHSREAAADTMEIMKEHAQGIPGVIHCYSYSLEMAKEYVKMGYYLGIGGVVTFKNAKKIKEVVEEIPLENLLLETDCPYLAPVPYRGKRNQSSYIQHVAETIAEIKGLPVGEVICVTEENARKMYRISDDTEGR